MSTILSIILIVINGVAVGTVAPMDTWQFWVLCTLPAITRFIGNIEAI